MSFWNTSDGEVATDTGTEYEQSGGFVIIPDDSNVMAFINSAGWADDNGLRYVLLSWTIVKPQEVVGVKIPQKLWVQDDDPRAKDGKKKRDKALRMLAAIDANCGGRLSKLQAAPTDKQLLIALTNKEMVIKVKVWSMDGDNGKMEGNWIAGVFPKTKAVELKGEVTKAAPKPKPAADPFSDLDDDIPF